MLTCDEAREMLAEALRNTKVSIADLAQLILSAMEVCHDSEIREVLGIKESVTNRAIQAYMLARGMYKATDSEWELPVVAA